MASITSGIGMKPKYTTAAHPAANADKYWVYAVPQL